jgi:hypothetical protein
MEENRIERVCVCVCVRAWSGVRHGTRKNTQVSKVS